METKPDFFSRESKECQELFHNSQVLPSLKAQGPYPLRVRKYTGQVRHFEAGSPVPVGVCQQANQAIIPEIPLCEIKRKKISPINVNAKV